MFRRASYFIDLQTVCTIIELSYIIQLYHGTFSVVVIG